MEPQAYGALMGGVFLVIIIFFVLIFTALTIFIWWKILSKAGYHGALSLLMLIPIANLVLLIYIALAEWPILKEIKQLKSMVSHTPPPPIP